MNVSFHKKKKTFSILSDVMSHLSDQINTQ